MTIALPRWLVTATAIVRGATLILLVLAAVSLPVVAFLLPEDAQTIGRAARVRAALTMQEEP